MLLKINDKNNCYIIKRMRKSANLKQNELGLATGYSASTICKIEKGKKIPTIIDLYNFANATNCQISITFKIPVYSKYRKDVIDYEMVCLGDFEISNSEIGFSDSDKRRIKETLILLLRSIEGN